MLDPALGYLIVGGIAVLFAGAAVHKWQDPVRFAHVFAAYGVMPGAAARGLAPLIPCLEFGTALGLLWQPSRTAAIAVGMVLLCGYAAALGLNLRRGNRDLDCGCGPARERRPIAAWMVWRNLLLAAALGVALRGWSVRAFGLTDVLTVAGGLLAGATLYAAVDRLLGDVAPKTALLRGTS
jgi:Methylamine utilisation protein MauE